MRGSRRCSAVGCSSCKSLGVPKWTSPICFKGPEGPCERHLGPAPVQTSQSSLSLIPVSGITYVFIFNRVASFWYKLHAVYPPRASCVLSYLRMGVIVVYCHCWTIEKARWPFWIETGLWSNFQRENTKLLTNICVFYCTGLSYYMFLLLLLLNYTVGCQNVLLNQYLYMCCQKKIETFINSSRPRWRSHNFDGLKSKLMYQWNECYAFQWHKRLQIPTIVWWRSKLFR